MAPLRPWSESQMPSPPGWVPGASTSPWASSAPAFGSLIQTWLIKEAPGRWTNLGLGRRVRTPVSCAPDSPSHREERRRRARLDVRPLLLRVSSYPGWPAKAFSGFLTQVWRSLRATRHLVVEGGVCV